MWFLLCSRPTRLLRRTKPSSQADQLAVSLITVAEIEYGMEAKDWGSARRDLMRRFLALLPDAETARVWARIKSGCDKKGRPIAFADAWIAAAAMQLNVPLVTHNATDYQAVEGLAVLTASAAI
jgi:tRNA(fMet)-specific endonuclease VapC